MDGLVNTSQQDLELSQTLLKLRIELEECIYADK